MGIVLSRSPSRFQPLTSVRAAVSPVRAPFPITFSTPGAWKPTLRVSKPTAQDLKSKFHVVVSTGQYTSKCQTVGIKMRKK
jgi:hypothetical protein